jgi:hypothetical protein
MSETLLKDFRTIILNYMKRRTSDPFMEWFRQREKTNVFSDDFERILSVLIAARFDQNTSADSAFTNTQTVISCGSLKRVIKRKDLPLLIPKGGKLSAEDWTRLFCTALPALREVSNKIMGRRSFQAGELLDHLLGDWRVPYLAVKTSRLAVRWLYELVPSLTIDMRTYKIPIDKLVYRVSCRLGGINPHSDFYCGNDSPGDLKIEFRQKNLP